MSGQWWNHRPLILTGLLALLLLTAPIANAACTNPAAGVGSIVYNSAQNVPQVCTGSGWVALGELNPTAGGGSCSNPSAVEGAIVYNNDFNVLQYCNGTNWIAVQAAPSGGGCAAPSGCTSIGDACTDGSDFAGFIVHGSSCNAIFATASDDATSNSWKTSTGSNDIATDSTRDGLSNQNQITISATYPAFQTCANLNRHSKTDWYLPSRLELLVLHENEVALGGFANDLYVSSSEAGTGDIWIQGFDTDDNSYKGTKTDTYRVRCIRRD